MNYFEYRSKQKHIYTPKDSDIVEFDNGIEVKEFETFDEFKKEFRPKRAPDTKRVL